MCKVHEIQVLVSINKILLEHGWLVCLCIVLSYFCAMIAEWSSCDRGRVAIKGENTTWPFTEGLPPWSSFLPGCCDTMTCRVSFYGTVSTPPFLSPCLLSNS